MRKKLLATVAIAAVCFGGPALAEEAIVNQSGAGNTADVDQTLDADLVTTGLVSNENVATVDQTGDLNDATVRQGHTPPGIDDFAIAVNEADIDQVSEVGSAVGNVADVTQFSDISAGAAPNLTDVDQYTAGVVSQTAIVTQVGGQGNSATVAQGQDFDADEGGEVASVAQTGSDNLATVTQGGTVDYATVTQAGLSNNADVDQEGEGGVASIEQTGNDNSSVLSQDGIGAYADNVQTGNDNSSLITQVDDSPNGSIGIDNAYNADPESTVLQYGDDNASQVVQ